MILRTGQSKTIRWGGNYNDALSATVNLYYTNDPVDGATWTAIALGVENTIGIVNSYVWTNSGSDIPLRYIKITDADDESVLWVMPASRKTGDNSGTSCAIAIMC